MQGFSLDYTIGEAMNSTRSKSYTITDKAIKGVFGVKGDAKKMKELKQAIKEEAEKEIIKGIESVTKNLNKCLSWHGKQYQGDEETQKQKLLRFIKRRVRATEAERLAKVEAVEASNDFGGELIITLEWKKSYMWGMNPRASTNYGFQGSSIGGCGYCKTSTATAEALNSHAPILKALYLKECERLRELKKSTMSKEDQEKYLSRRSFVGYGTGYGVMPYFEGGVGVSSHESTCKKIGLNMRSISDTPHVNVYIVDKGVQ